MSKITLLETETPQPPAPGKVSLFIGEDGELYKIDSSDKLTRINQQVWKAGYKLEFMGRTYGVVQSLTGRLWLDRNLGAARLPSVRNDYNGYGDYYQWGRGPDGHQQQSSDLITSGSPSDTPGHGKFVVSSANWKTTSSSELWHPVLRRNLPAPIGWRIPTKEEWQEEIDTWNSVSAVGAFESVLKIPSAGLRSFSSSGSVLNAGNEAFLWSCSCHNNENDYAYVLELSSSWQTIHYRETVYGYSVRLIRDE